MDFPLVARSFLARDHSNLGHNRRRSMIRNDVANWSALTSGESGESTPIPRPYHRSRGYCVTCETVSRSRERTSFPSCLIDLGKWRSTRLVSSIKDWPIRLSTTGRKAVGLVSYLSVHGRITAYWFRPMSSARQRPTSSISGFNGSFHRCRSPSKISFLYSMPRTRSRA